MEHKRESVYGHRSATYHQLVNISTNGTISATGAISGGSITSTGVLAITGTLSAVLPTVSGVHTGSYSGYAAMYFTAPNGAYIDFTAVGSSTKGRMMYTRSTDQYDWYIVSSSPSKMTLMAAGLYVGATLVSASDKRLKFNEQRLVNALDIIGQLEPV